MTLFKNVRIIAICGGSGSGKTTLLKKILQTFPQESAAVFQDSYYIDQSANFKEDGGEVNFDHPNSLDFELLAKQLKQLRTKSGIDIPVYDFVTHKRLGQIEHLEPKPIILVDGTLILSQEKMRDLFDHSVFLAVPEHIRFERRKNRDLNERGRQLDGIVRQFYNHVKPMHDEFVEPSKMYATKIYSEVQEFDKAYGELKSFIEKNL